MEEARDEREERVEKVQISVFDLKYMLDGQCPMNYRFVHKSCFAVL